MGEGRTEANASPAAWGKAQARRARSDRRVRLQQWLQQSPQSFQQPLPEPPVAPLNRVDQPRGGNVLRKECLHGLPEVVAEDDDVDLVVANDAAPVEVAGADRREDAIDHRRLGVHHRVLELVNAHACVQHLPIVRTRRVKDEIDVALAGEYPVSYTHLTLPTKRIV